MRAAVVMALVLLCGCASDKLALAPPPGVDFSGHWRLNVEESDDPLHLLQSQNVDPSKATPSSQGQGGQGGRGGRSGRGGAFPTGVNQPGPTMPGVGVLSAALRWPGQEVDIQQHAGIVTIRSGGVDQIYQPTAGDLKRHPHRWGDGHGEGDDNRDMPARERGPPPTCGWDEGTLVVQPHDGDEDQPSFEKRYSLSADGQRLIEVVGFKGGRYGGFNTSRAWDRADAIRPENHPQ